jgi:hypothetical protein
MEVIETRFAPQQKHLQDQLTQVSATWQSIWDEENREPRYSSPFFYWPFMAALALCEVPVNRLSFELFFRESPIVAMVVAGLVGVVLMALAHGVGVVTRRMGYHSKDGVHWVGWAWLVVYIAVISTLVYGIAVFRQGYLSFVAQPDPSFADLMQSGQVGEVALAAITAGLGIEGWIFLFINTAIVVVGIAAAYLCHDPHPDFEKADKSKRKLTKAMAKIDRLKGRRESREKDRHANVMRRLGSVA